MGERSPWHRGEVALQSSAGVAERMQEIGRITIRDHLIGQHRDFYPLLSMVVLGSVDERGDAWATVRTGAPGFMQAPDELHLHLALARDWLDPAERGLDDGSQAALLGIDLSTRRRNRLNGTVGRDRDGFSLKVEQSFGNCPKYIQRREPTAAADLSVLSSEPPVSLPVLEGPALDLVRGADTLFVATYADIAGRRSVDVSHRGGAPGFVRVDGDGLTIPDYAGNKYFNTLGNVIANPRAGLTFVGFDTGDLLQMTGSAELVGAPGDVTDLAGAERFWRFRPERILWRPSALALCWRLVEWSPFLPAISA